MLKRKRPRPTLNSLDRFFWSALCRFSSRWADALVIVKPKTVIGWHRGPVFGALALAITAARRPAKNH